MSTYSAQIQSVLDERLVPRMQELIMEVARIEPYSYSSTVLENCKRQLDYYSIIYDFLQEYVDGTEEMDNAKLVNVVRLLEARNASRQISDFFSRPKEGYKLYINKELVNEKTIITPGSLITITIEYTPAEEVLGHKSIRLTVDGITQVSDGFTASIQNKVIPLSAGGTNMTVSYQALEDGISIPPAQAPVLIPIQYLMENAYYYGSGAVGLTEDQIRNLTKVIEERGNKTLRFDPVSQVVYYAYPESYGTLASAEDENGFDILSDFTLHSHVLFNIQIPNFGPGTAYYNVYEYNNVSTVADFYITFNF